VAIHSSVLNGRPAVQLGNIIVRAFVRPREMLTTHKDLARKMEHLEREPGKGTIPGCPFSSRRRIGFATSGPER
jgi:hypothetical protein